MGKKRGRYEPTKASMVPLHDTEKWDTPFGKAAQAERQKSSAPNSAPKQFVNVVILYTRSEFGDDVIFVQSYVAINRPDLKQIMETAFRRAHPRFTIKEIVLKPEQQEQS